jgi:hypothetical protein
MIALLAHFFPALAIARIAGQVLKALRAHKAHTFPERDYALIAICSAPASVSFATPRRSQRSQVLALTCRLGAVTTHGKGKMAKLIN